MVLIFKENRPTSCLLIHWLIWLMSHSHGRALNSRCLSENSTRVSLPPEIFRAWCHFGCWNSWTVKHWRATKRAFYFWNPAAWPSGDRTTARHSGHPWTVCLRLRACVVPSCQSQGCHPVGLCRGFVFVGSLCISIQPWGCAASWEGSVCGGLSYWKTLDAALVARRVNPQRQSVAWFDSTFESQQTCDRRVVQLWNSVGFKGDLCLLACWSIKL